MNHDAEMAVGIPRWIGHGTKPCRRRSRLFNELSEIFRDDCPAVMAEMKSAIATSNPDALRRAAHRLKARSEYSARRIRRNWRATGTAGQLREMCGRRRDIRTVGAAVGLVVHSLFRIGEPQHECSDRR